MMVVATVDDFLSSPFGRFVFGRTWLSFCTDVGLAGLLVWGRPDADDVAPLLRAIPVHDSPLAEPRDRYLDLHRIESLDAPIFAAFAEYVATERERMRASIRCIAVTHGTALMGAVAQGFGTVAPTPFPVRLFADPADALGWLGAPSSLAIELEQLQAAALDTTPLVRDMRAQLRGQLRGAALATMAAALGLSARSLQRKLREHGTSFQHELNRLRVEESQQLLAGSDSTVTEIAMAVGSASVHHFGTLFRRFTGMTPTQWRASSREACAGFGRSI